MPLDTEIEMSPASGLAQVELVPKRKAFLHGQRVFLDYSTMEDATEAERPKPKLGSPPITKIPIDPKDEKILAEKAADLLDEIRKYIFFEGSPDIIVVLNEFTE